MRRQFNVQREIIVKRSLLTTQKHFEIFANQGQVIFALNVEKIQ